jgi:hypothetical protein
MPADKSEYIPGVCNIGHAEIKRRKLIGWTAGVATIALAAILVLTRLAPYWRLLLFFPASIAAVGFLQAAWHFCAKFGLDGALNFGPKVGRTDTVDGAAFRRQDRRTALKIIALSALAGAIVTAATYFLPF